MRITTVKRNHFSSRAFYGSFVTPVIEFIHDGNDEPIFRNKTANGLVINRIWYELPDEPDGEYALIEDFHTNPYGYYENGGSEITLVTQNYVDTLEQQTGAGIIDQLAVIQIQDRAVVCKYDRLNLVRKQGV